MERERDDDVRQRRRWSRERSEVRKKLRVDGDTVSLF